MALNDYKILGQQTSGIYERWPVIDRTLTSNVATVTLGFPYGGSNHGFVAGDRFDLNGLDQSILNFRGVVSASPSFNTFSFPRTNANLTTSTQTSAFVYKYANGQGNTITNKAKASGVATLTTATSHNFNVGDWITVYINDTLFDGDFIVSSTPSANTFSYVSLGSNVTSAAVSSGAVAVQKAITLYTVPSGDQAVCSTMVVSNNLTHSAYFSLYAVVSGDSATTPPDKSIISNRTIVAAGESYNMTLGHTLSAGDKMVFRASHAGMFFTMFGTELS